MNSDFTGPINLGNPEEFTIIELAKKVIEKIDPSLEIEYKKLPEDDPKRRRPDIKLAKEVIHWQPNISLSEGLDKTIKYFKSFY